MGGFCPPPAIPPPAIPPPAIRPLPRHSRAGGNPACQPQAASPKKSRPNRRHLAPFPRKREISRHLNIHNSGGKKTVRNSGDSRLRGNGNVLYSMKLTGWRRTCWIPAFAGMTARGETAAAYSNYHTPRRPLAGVGCECAKAQSRGVA